MAADRGRRDDAGARADGGADRGDGRAPHGSTAAAEPTNAGLTKLRFCIDSGGANRVLVDFRMSLATAELPTDPAEPRVFELACRSELEVAEISVQYKTREIEQLKFQIAELRWMQFGRSSERISHQIEQLELRLEELETGQAEEVAKAEASAPTLPIRERANPKRKPLPDHLPRQGVVHQPADDRACTCPDCGRGMAKLGEDITEVLSPRTESAIRATRFRSTRAEVVGAGANQRSDTINMTALKHCGRPVKPRTPTRLTLRLLYRTVRSAIEDKATVTHLSYGNTTTDERNHDRTGARLVNGQNDRTTSCCYRNDRNP